MASQIKLHSPSMFILYKIIVKSHLTVTGLSWRLILSNFFIVLLDTSLLLHFQFIWCQPRWLVLVYISALVMSCAFLFQNFIFKRVWQFGVMEQFESPFSTPKFKTQVVSLNLLSEVLVWWKLSGNYVSDLLELCNRHANETEQLTWFQQFIFPLGFNSPGDLL